MNFPRKRVLKIRFGMEDRALRCETTHQVIQISPIDDHFSRCTVTAAGAIVPLW